MDPGVWVCVAYLHTCHMHMAYACTYSDGVDMDPGVWVCVTFTLRWSSAIAKRMTPALQTAPRPVPRTTSRAQMSDMPCAACAACAAFVAFASAVPPTSAARAVHSDDSSHEKEAKRQATSAAIASELKTKVGRWSEYAASQPLEQMTASDRRIENTLRNEASPVSTTADTCRAHCGIASTSASTRKPAWA